jgi:hypothetical protein
MKNALAQPVAVLDSTFGIVILLRCHIIENLTITTVGPSSAIALDPDPDPDIAPPVVLQILMRTDKRWIAFKRTVRAHPQWMNHNRSQFHRHQEALDSSRLARGMTVSVRVATWSSPKFLRFSCQFLMMPLILGEMLLGLVRGGFSDDGVGNWSNRFLHMLSFQWGRVLAKQPFCF